jgi:hypothetical protein
MGDIHSDGLTSYKQAGDHMAAAKFQVQSRGNRI